MTTLSSSAATTNHVWPQFLPDGHRFIFYQRSDDSMHQGIYFGTLASGVTQAEQQAGGEVALGHPLLGNPAGLLQADAGAGPQEEVNDAQGDRHHHGRALGVGTHLLRKAVTTMKPPTMAPGRAPPRRGVKKAIRRSGPQRSMASPRMNQPMKEENHVRGKGARTLPEGRNASSGKAAIGRSA